MKPPLAVLLAALALLGACSGDAIDDSDAAPPDEATTTTTTTTTIAGAAPVVAVYGDSLAMQAWGEIKAAGEELGYTVVGEGVPGDAVCDAIPRIVEVMEDPPDYVVLAYIGNNRTPCTGNQTGEELGHGYEEEAEHAAELTEGTQLVFVGPPDSIADHFRQVAPIVRERYQLVADRYEHVTFVDGRALLSPDGYSQRLPCRATEGAEQGCVDGEIAVRLSDGVHLSYPFDGYSAGAQRWAETVVSSLPPANAADLGLPPLPPLATAVPPDAFATLTDPGDGGVAVFGDSLTLQASPYLTAIGENQQHAVSVAAYGGAALCDWFPTLEATIANDAPVDIVLAFAGNNLTPCIATDDGDELIAAYVRDVEHVVDLAEAAGIAVTLAGPPDMGKPDENSVAVALRLAFAEVEGVTYVDLVTALSPNGFTDVLPCLTFETAEYGCVNGLIPVRDADGVHLSGPNEAGYSSGAWRYAAALLNG